MKTCFVLFSLFAALGAIAHPGGLDANGGHIDRKTGIYHYHRGTNAPSGNAPVQSLSPRIAPAPQAAPSQNQSTTPGVSDGGVKAKRIERETKAVGFQGTDAEAGSASALNKVPWWVYLVGIGCGYVVWELASNYYQKKKSKH